MSPPETKVDNELVVSYACNENSFSDEKGVFVAHALGGIDGVVYSNSLEAFEQNYADGRRWFEVDLTLTSDGELALFHPLHERHLGLDVPFSEVDANTFLGLRYRGLTTMMFRELLERMAAMHDVFVVLDTKDWSQPVLDAVSRDLQGVSVDVGRRIVPQIYRPEDLEPVRGVWDDNLGISVDAIWTLYAITTTDEEVVTFAEQNGDVISVITMHYRNRYNQALQRELQERGFGVYLHTVPEAQIEDYVCQGVDGIYFDFLGGYGGFYQRKVL